MNELVEPKSTLVPQQSEAASIMSIIDRAARDPSIDVDKLQRLLDLHTQIQSRQAEAAFDFALNEAQAEMRPIARDSSNPQTRSKYTSYTQLDLALRPIYTKYGFSLSFNTSPDAPEQSVRVTCRMSKGGYSRTYQIDMPADGKGAKGGDVMTRTHATGSAVSYGMRYLLKMIFNVATGEYDDDGNAAGKRHDERKPTVSEKSPVQPVDAKPPPEHDPVTGEVGPREIALPVADTEWRRYLAWGGQYIQAINFAKSLAEADAWTKANAKMLKKLEDGNDDMRRIVRRIDANVLPAREKLMKAEEAKGGGIPPQFDRRKLAPTPADPEAFLAHITETLGHCTTQAELTSVWNGQFLPKLGDMFPPDAAVAMETFEELLNKIAETELMS